MIIVSQDKRSIVNFEKVKIININSSIINIHIINILNIILFFEIVLSNSNIANIIPIEPPKNDMIINNIFVSLLYLNLFNIIFIQYKIKLIIFIITKYTFIKINHFFPIYLFFLFNI